MRTSPSPPSSPRDPQAAGGAPGGCRPPPGGGAPASPPPDEALPPARRMTPQEMMPLLDRVPLAEGASVPALWETRFSAEEVAGVNARAAAHLAVVNPQVQQMLLSPPAPRAGARDSALGIRDTAADLAAAERRLAGHISALATPWPPPDLTLVEPAAVQRAELRLGTVWRESWAALTALGEAAGDHAMGAHATLADALEHAELRGAAPTRAVPEGPSEELGWQPRVWSLRLAVGGQLRQWGELCDALPIGTERIEWLKVVQPRAFELEWLRDELQGLGDRLQARRWGPSPG